MVETEIEKSLIFSKTPIALHDNVLTGDLELITSSNALKTNYEWYHLINFIHKI